jgi:hypothetical protein
MKQILVLALSLMFGIVLNAGERVNPDNLKVKSLPEAIYAKLEKSKRLSRLWQAAEFAPGRGFKVGDIEWKAENRVGEVASYLKEQVQTIGSKNGFYTLDLVVTEALAGKASMVWNTTGYFILEGRVTDPEGHVVAAFVTKEEDSQFTGFTLKPGIDNAISGIVSELFKKREVIVKAPANTEE